jgi:uncharacterized protein (UPF0335 family)
MDTQAILKAVDKLDVNDDNHWTTDGLPKMEVMQNLSGVKELTRAQMNEAVPNLSRDAMKAAQGGGAPLQPPKPKVVPDAEPAEDPTFGKTPAEVAAEVDELEQEKQHLAKQASDILDEIRKLQTAYDETLREVDEVQKQINERTPSGTNSNAIRAYIEASNAERHERATGAAPIDKALGGRPRKYPAKFKVGG